MSKRSKNSSARKRIESQKKRDAARLFARGPISRDRPSASVGAPRTRSLDPASTTLITRNRLTTGPVGSRSGRERSSRSGSVIPLSRRETVTSAGRLTPKARAARRKVPTKLGAVVRPLGASSIRSRAKSEEPRSEDRQKNKVPAAVKKAADKRQPGRNPRSEKRSTEGKRSDGQSDRKTADRVETPDKREERRRPDAATCKPRPSASRGDGSGRDFVPWCSRRS